MSSTAKRLQGERGPGGPQGLWAQCKGPDRQSSGLCWLDLTPGNAFQRPCDRKNKRSIITYPLLLPSCGSLRGQQVKHLRPKGVRAGVGWAMTTSVPLEGSIAQTQSRTPFSIALRIHGGAPSSEGLRVLPGWQCLQKIIRRSWGPFAQVTFNPHGGCNEVCTAHPFY